MYRRNQAPPIPVEESESESESESSEEDNEESSVYLVRQMNSAPPQPAPFPEEEESASETEFATPTKPVAVAAKRTIEDTSNSKPSNAKFLHSQKLWNDEAEIALLLGMMDYKFTRNSDPIADFDAFYESIRKKLHINISRMQLQDKLGRLRKNFENNKRKVKESGGGIFSSPHDQKVYDLSKLLFRGNETDEVNRVVKEGNETLTLSEEEAKIVKNVNGTESEQVKNVKNTVVVGGKRRRLNELDFSSGGASMEQTMLKTGGEFYEAGLGTEGENEWDKLREEEIKLRREEMKLRREKMKLYLNQLEMRAAQTKLVLGVMNFEDA